MVIDAEPLAPEINVIPVVLASWKMPEVALIVSSSVLLPALPSAMLIASPFAAEKVVVPPTADLTLVGALIEGGALPETLIDTLAEPDR
jgi:hypothetical protein